MSRPGVYCISAHSWISALDTSLLTLQTVLLRWENNLRHEHNANVFAIMETNKWWKKNEGIKEGYSISIVLNRCHL